MPRRPRASRARVASIDLEDVRKLDATPGRRGVSTVKIEQTDAPAVTLRLRKDGDAHWLSVTATGEGEAKKAAAEITSARRAGSSRFPTFKAERDPEEARRPAGCRRQLIGVADRATSPSLPPAVARVGVHAA